LSELRTDSLLVVTEERLLHERGVWLVPVVVVTGVELR